MYPSLRVPTVAMRTTTTPPPPPTLILSVEEEGGGRGMRSNNLVPPSPRRCESLAAVVSSLASTTLAISARRHGPLVPSPRRLGRASRSLSPYRGAAAVTIARDSYAATAADCPRRCTGPRRTMGPSDRRRRGVGTTRTLSSKIEHASSGNGVGRHLLLHKSANGPTHQFCYERD
jgi:hypothetical protein